MQEELYIRVKQALTWLKRNKGILQKDIAEKMGMAEASFTRALARIKEKNDEDFVISFHSAVEKYISLDYLLTGKGKLLRMDQAIDNLEHETRETQKVIDGFDSHTRQETPQAIDYSFLIEKAVEKATAYADKTISVLERRIEEKDKYIAVLERRISELEAQDGQEILRKHPFPVAVADGQNKNNEHASV